MNKNLTASPAPELLRLNKVLARAGIASRRGADELILAGKVKVNGQIITQAGTKIAPQTDVIEVNGKELRGNTAQQSVYIKLYKPIEIVCTVRDPQKRKTVIDLLPSDLRATRLFPIGRLDYYSEGLLLLTNDGDFTHRLLHPKYNHPKTYEVLVREDVPEASLKLMRAGMRLSEGEKLAPVQARIHKKIPRGTLLELVLVQGVNRQIRRMCRDLDLTILRLKRIAQAGIQLGSLKPGQWAHLTTHELQTAQQTHF